MRGWLIALAALMANPALASSGNVASAMGEASASVVEPIAVMPVADLDFGNVASDGPLAGDGAVELVASEAARYSGMARAACEIGAECPLPHAAAFAVTGEAGRAYAISAPLVLTIAPRALDGADLNVISTLPLALSVDAITVRSASRPEEGASGVLDAQGHDRFEISGRLNVPSGMPPARYVTQIRVMVIYS